MDDFSDRVWLALVEGKQTGPLDAHALADWVRRGHVTVQTYFWRRGMSEWKRGAEIPELAYLFGTKIAERPPAPPAGERAPSDSLSGLSASDVVPPLPGTAAESSEPTEETSLGLSGIWSASSRKGGRRTLAAALVGGLSAFGLAVVALTTLGSVAIRDRGERPAQIERAIAQAQASLQGCIEDALHADPNLRIATFHLTATVSSSGVVRDAAVDRREIDASALGECLKVRARRMVLAPFSGEEVRIAVPLAVGTGL